jgi:hypothetical protein
MSLAADISLSIIIVVIIFIILAFVWDKFIGLTKFSAGKSSVVSWFVTGKKDITDLRFQECIFTVVMPSGVTKSVDVSSVINGMAAAYVGNAIIPQTLTLVKPLNPFSFVIKGFNDVATVPNPSTPAWKNAKVTLTGKYRIL